MNAARDRLIKAMAQAMADADGPEGPSYEHLAAAAMHALRATLPELGLRVVPTVGNVDMVAAFWRRKNGHHFHDEPPPSDTSDMAAIRDALAAAPDVLAPEPQSTINTKGTDQ